MLLSLALGMQAQDNNLFSKFSNNKDITTVFISKSILKLAPNMDLGGASVGNLIGKLDKLEIYTSDNPSASAIMKKEGEAFTKSKTYENLMTVRDGEQNIDFLINADGENIKELVMFISESSECTIMRVIGNFTMEDIQKVIADNGKK